MMNDYFVMYTYSSASGRFGFSGLYNVYSYIHTFLSKSL